MLRIDFTEEVAALVEKIETGSIKMGDITHVNYGAQMSSKKKGEFGKEHVLRNSKLTASYRKTISGRDLYRYRANWNGRYVEWALAPEMYGPRMPWFFENPKLMIRDITGTHRIEAARDETALYCDHTILCAQRLADLPAAQQAKADAAKVRLSKLYSLDFLQAVVASRLVSAYYYWVLTGEGVRTGGGFHTYPTTVRALPVPNKSTMKDAAGSKLMAEIASLATRVSDNNTRLQDEKSPSRRDQIAQRIQADDERIDDLIYRLYGLDKRQISLVEAATTQ